MVLVRLRTVVVIGMFIASASGVTLGAALRTDMPGSRGATGASGGDIAVSQVGLRDFGCEDDFIYHGLANGVRAFTVASTMCNLGAAAMDVTGVGVEHPVIGQNLFRLQDGRFEQIGQSWVMHTFCAVNEQTCGDCQPSSCSTLGAGCASTQYGAISDGALGGPKVYIDPQGLGAGGTHADHNWAGPSGPPEILGRLQVRDADILTGAATEIGVHYVAEVQYVTHDEDRGDRNNNCSWRAVQFDDPMTLVGAEPCRESVHMTEPAIAAWRSLDPEVVLSEAFEVPETNWGLITVGHRVYDNGDGTWDYEYAAHNMNASRAVGRFVVPVPDGVAVSDIGFHDVDYHSGDGIGGADFDGTDWTAPLENGQLSWSTDDHATNPDANALRWGTLYNFRFTADAPPAPAQLTLGLFTPGTPDDVTLAAVGPQPGPAVPAASTWGLIILAVLVGTVGSSLLRQRAGLAS